MARFDTGSVQPRVPCASAMKLATALGACFWKNWQVMRPIDVSITTVGPLGTTLAAAVAWGASGSGSCAGGLDCCDRHAAAKTMDAANDEVRKTFLNVIPNSRVNHRAEMLPTGKRLAVAYRSGAIRRCIVFA